MAAAIGTWAASAAITTALGPPLGGWLVDAIGWRAIFFINVPIGALALLFGLKLPADAGTASKAPLDLRGGLLAIVALGSLSYGLVALGAGNVTTGVIGIVASLPAIWWFIRTEGARARADDAAGPVSQSDLRRRQRSDGAPLRRLEPGVVPFAASARRRTSLQCDRGGRVLPAVLCDHGCGIAVGRQAGRFASARGRS